MCSESGRFANHKLLLSSKDISVDAVIITSPDHTHHEIVMDAANSGKHIFCEKPMALSLKHCFEMQRAAESSNVIFMMGFCLRYNNLYLRAKEIIKSGQIGKVRSAYAVDSVERGSAFFFHGWHRLKKYSGGMLLQKATHSIDIINWLLNAEPVSVYAIGSLDVFGGKESSGKHCGSCEKRKTCPEFIDASKYHSDYLNGKTFVVEDKCVFAKEIDICDNETLLIRYDNGAKASFVECQYTPDYKREFSFVGDKGRLDILDFYSHNGTPSPRNEITISRRHSGEIAKQIVPLRPGGHGGGDPAMIEDFLEALRNGTHPVADGMTGVISTAVAEAAEKSIESGNVEIIKIKEFSQ